MVTVIGQENCMKCKMAEKKLILKEIAFKYIPFSSLDNKDEIMSEANKKDLLNFPIIMKDNILVRLEEVLV